ncbi:hypothetical protein OGAPHI_006380 [Ogataea philodendri]|uniref:Uncharacterized protein n=1 Tax=Ogataea philodendri TaxID=1378263 RepID=A0A9P8NXT4_9ASCO|nr:uncharacterized protein OGAPHI_006380 [Ogataea philodendri]KAH3661532.1 hypothetical protein OGAPHI_006380 [Ogataea philodendri]
MAGCPGTELSKILLFGTSIVTPVKTSCPEVLSLLIGTALTSTTLQIAAAFLITFLANSTTSISLNDNSLLKTDSGVSLDVVLLPLWEALGDEQGQNTWLVLVQVGRLTLLLLEQLTFGLSDRSGQGSDVCQSVGQRNREWLLWSWPFGVQNGLLVSQNFFINELGKVWGNWRHQNGLGLKVLDNQVFVHAITNVANFSVVISGSLVVKESKLKTCFEVSSIVLLISLVDQRVHLVVKCFVKEVVLSGSESVDVLDNVLGPVFQSVHSENGGVCVTLVKVGIFNTVTRVSKSNSGSISTELLHHLGQSQEVSCRLGHLGVVQHQVTITSDTLWPELLLEQGNVTVDEESQVVWNQIFSRNRHVCWIEVFKLSSHDVKLFLRNVTLNLVDVTEDIIPNVIGHLFNLDSKWSRNFSVDVLVEKMRHSVVGVVDSRVGKRFNKVLWIPWDSGSQTVTSRNSPVLQPVENTFKSVSALSAVCVQVGETFQSLLLPGFFTVVQVPLILKRNNTLISRSRNDLRFWLTLFSGCKRNGILRRVDLQLLHKILGTKITILFSLDDRNWVLDNPLLFNAVVLRLVVKISGGGIVIRRVRWDTSNNTSTLRFQNGFHRKHSELFQWSQRSVNLRTNQSRSRNLQNVIVVTSNWGNLLVTHVLERFLGTDVVFSISSVEQSVINLWRHKTTRLTVHGFWSQGCCNKVHLLTSQVELLILQDLLSLFSKLGNFNLDTSVLLRENSLSGLSVVVHTWLTILHGVNRVSLTESDLVLLLQLVHLPSNKRIIESVVVSSDGRSSPVNLSTKRTNLLFNKRRKVRNPVVWVGEVLDLRGWNTQLLHNLKLSSPSWTVGREAICVWALKNGESECEKNKANFLETDGGAATGTGSSTTGACSVSVEFNNVRNVSVVFFESVCSSTGSVGFFRNDGKNSVSISSSSSSLTCGSSAGSSTGSDFSISKSPLISPPTTSGCSKTSSSSNSMGFSKSKESIHDSNILLVRSFSSLISSSVSPILISVFTFSTV